MSARDDAVKFLQEAAGPGWRVGSVIVDYEHYAIEVHGARGERLRLWWCEKEQVSDPETGLTDWVDKK